MNIPRGGFGFEMPHRRNRERISALNLQIKGGNERPRVCGSAEWT